MKREMAAILIGAMSQLTPSAGAGTMSHVLYTSNTVIRTAELMDERLYVREEVRAMPYSLVADFQSGEAYSFTVLAPPGMLFSYDPGTSTPVSVNLRVGFYFTENGQVGSGLSPQQHPDVVEFVGASASAPDLINGTLNARADGTGIYTAADAATLTQAFFFQGFRFTGSVQFGTAGAMTYYHIYDYNNIAFEAEFNGAAPDHQFLSLVQSPVMIDSIRGNGTMTFSGVATGTTAVIEWAASLTEAGRTNWHTLTTVPVTGTVMTNDVPMFFRVRGIPAP
ncbi:MAG: hypothetical protein PHV28_14620 [Kiritimatiellae bacterium]|nr:hypothetical protein [Kiritimatiellia bacterium]